MSCDSLGKIRSSVQNIRTHGLQVNFNGFKAAHAALFSWIAAVLSDFSAINISANNSGFTQTMSNK